MKSQKSKLRASLLVYMLGVFYTSLTGTGAVDLCDASMCGGLDNCQSVADALCAGLVNFTNSQDVRIYQLSNTASNSVALYNMTSRYLSVFKGLSSALGIYTTSSSYRDESKNVNVLALTNRLKNNLSFLIAYTDQAVEDMAWTLYGDNPVASPAVVISPNKTVIYGLGYRVSDMFRAMLRTWRLNCGACGRV